MVREIAGHPKRELVDTAANKERSFKKLAEACKEHLDMDAILKLLETKIY
jgi:cobyric acid synthase